MPTLLVRRRAVEHPEDERTAEIVRRLDGDLQDDAVLAEVVNMLREDPALEETRELADRTAAEAITILEQLPVGPVRAALIPFTTSLGARRR